LEDIDSIPALIELLSFLSDDKLNMMVTHQRILELVKSCSANLKGDPEDSEFRPLVVEKEMPNSLLQDTSGFAGSNKISNIV